jgi:hypothetical protein
MERRKFIEKVGVGSAAAVAALAGGATTARTPPTPKPTQRESDRHDHDDRPVKGALATATVSFGAWQTQPPPGLDRHPYPPPPGPPAGNVHKLIPYQVTIKVGGTVNFILAGLHQVIVYAPGKSPEEVNVALTRPTQGVPPPGVGPLLINDPIDRLYVGLDPSTVHGGPPNPRTPLLDRIEVVQFTRKGRHLVICGVVPHFVNDNMYGWVKVVGDDDDED